MQTIESAPVSKLEGFKLPIKGATAAAPEAPDLDDLAKAPLESQDAEPYSDVPMTYEQRLKAFDITPEKALEIIDKLVVDGYYEEETNLSKSVKIKLKTRSARFNTYLADTIDIADPKKVGKLNHLMSLNQVAGSLEKYGPMTLAKLDDEMLDDVWEKALKSRVAFVSKLPSPVFLALNSKLADFDRRMLILFSDGYEKNF